MKVPKKAGEDRWTRAEIQEIGRDIRRAQQTSVGELTGEFLPDADAQVRALLAGATRRLAERCDQIGADASGTRTSDACRTKAGGVEGACLTMDVEEMKRYQAFAARWARSGGDPIEFVAGAQKNGTSLDDLLALVRTKVRLEPNNSVAAGVLVGLETVGSIQLAHVQGPSAREAAESSRRRASLTLQVAMRRGHDEALLLEKAADLLTAMGYQAEALPLLIEAHRAAPDCPRLLLRLVDARCQSGETLAALCQIERAPCVDDPRIQCARGDLLLRFGYCADARAIFEALDRTPDGVRDAGLAAALGGLRDEAAQEDEEAARAYDAPLRAALGRALEATTLPIPSLWWSSHAALALGDKDLLARVVERLLGVSSVDAECARGLSDLAAKLAAHPRLAGELVLVKRLFGRALEAEPGHPEYTRGLAEACLALGDPRQAERLLSSLPPNETSPRDLERIGDAHRVRGDLPSAAEAWWQALARGGGAFSSEVALVSDVQALRLRTGGAYLRLGRFDRAKALFKAARDAEPMGPEIRARLIEALFGPKKPDLAELRAEVDAAAELAPSDEKLMALDARLRALEAEKAEKLERAQAEKAQAEKAQAEKARAEHAQAEKARAEKARAENAPAEGARAEKAPAERAPAEKAARAVASASAVATPGPHELVASNPAVAPEAPGSRPRSTRGRRSERVPAPPSSGPACRVSGPPAPPPFPKVEVELAEGRRQGEYVGRSWNGYHVVEVDGAPHWFKDLEALFDERGALAGRRAEDKGLLDGLNAAYRIPVDEAMTQRFSALLDEPRVGELSARAFTNALEQAGHPWLLVGSAVTHGLLGDEAPAPRDLDILVATYPEEALRAVSKITEDLPPGTDSTPGVTSPYNSRFHGTITFGERGRGIDLVSMHQWGDHATQRWVPEVSQYQVPVAFGSSLVRDYLRRDFTFKGLMYSEADRCILDLSGRGGEDARARALKLIPTDLSKTKDLALRFFKERLAGKSADPETKRKILRNLRADFKKGAGDSHAREVAKLAGPGKDPVQVHDWYGHLRDQMTADGLREADLLRLPSSLAVLKAYQGMWRSGMGRAPDGQGRSASGRSRSLP